MALTRWSAAGRDRGWGARRHQMDCARRSISGAVGGIGPMLLCSTRATSLALGSPLEIRLAGVIARAAQPGHSITMSAYLVTLGTSNLMGSITRTRLAPLGTGVLAVIGRAGTSRRTHQVCVHCRENPAGFWVSCSGGGVTRRPWCLCCCQELDRGRCDIVPFGDWPGRRPN
jgi:hypothetical protein